jgi:hypothetical protein
MRKLIATAVALAAVAPAAPAVAKHTPTGPKATPPGQAKKQDQTQGHKGKAKGKAKANAARTCRAERAADPAGFKLKYGTGKHHANALGKCVSATVKAQHKAEKS